MATLLILLVALSEDVGLMKEMVVIFTSTGGSGKVSQALARPLAANSARSSVIRR